MKNGDHRYAEAFEKSETYENLKQAFMDEAGLYFRYLYFQAVADYEGQVKVTNEFKNLAKAGLDYVNGTLDLIRNYRDPMSSVPIGNAENNLNSVLQTEMQQSSETYPEMAKVARREGFTDVASWFDTLEKIKRVNFEKLKRVNCDQ